jgi:hypothetical protein
MVGVLFYVLRMMGVLFYAFFYALLFYASSTLHRTARPLG